MAGFFYFFAIFCLPCERGVTKGGYTIKRI